MTKVLRRHMPDAPPEELARFELRPDGQIEATYADESLRENYETEGVYTALHGDVRVADGARFLEALELSLSVSSFWRLEDLDAAVEEQQRRSALFEDAEDSERDRIRGQT